jgi:hypothetical protein
MPNRQQRHTASDHQYPGNKCSNEPQCTEMFKKGKTNGNHTSKRGKIGCEQSPSRCSPTRI